MVTIQDIRTKLIKEIRCSGMKQKEIAAKVHIAPATLSQYLSGRAMPALDTFANLCKVLDVDANDILCVV